MDINGGFRVCLGQTSTNSAGTKAADKSDSQGTRRSIYPLIAWSVKHIQGKGENWSNGIVCLGYLHYLCYPILSSPLNCLSYLVLRERSLQVLPWVNTISWAMGQICRKRIGCGKKVPKKRFSSSWQTAIWIGCFWSQSFLPEISKDYLVLSLVMTNIATV